MKRQMWSEGDQIGLTNMHAIVCYSRVYWEDGCVQNSMSPIVDISFN